MSLRELQLLLHCAKNNVDVQSLRKLVNEGIDWQNALDIAQRHRVRPLLHRGLKFACWDAVPQPRQVELESFERSNLQRNLLCTRELLRLLQILQNNGIAVMTFKGPVLASSAYGNLSLREFNDLDLMVNR